MNQSSMTGRYREWAQSIVRQADTEERQALSAWAKRLLEIRDGSEFPPLKVQHALTASVDLEISSKLVRLLGSGLRRVGWDERDTMERTGIAAVTAMALVTSAGLLALAAIGGTLSVPMWVVFGTGDEFARMLVEEAEAAVSADKAPPRSSKPAAEAEPAPAAEPVITPPPPVEPAPAAEPPQAADKPAAKRTRKTAKPSSAVADISEAAVLLRLASRYREDMSAQELYEVTRGPWRIAAAKRDRIEYALAIADGVVREVYRVEQWQEAGSTPYQTRPQAEVKVAGRWEFSGKPAPKAVRERYLGASVAEHYSGGNPNPVRYLNL